MGKNVTFSDIAKYTNFSKTTISRYFNNPDSLSDETKQKVRDALDALNYHENKVAKILARGKTEFIGVIAPNFFFPYYTSVLNSILDTYRDYGYKFIVFLENDNSEEERKYISELLSYNIEGLIVLSHTLPSHELQQLGIPVVAIEREDEFISSVNTNNFKGAVLAVEKLIADGCEFLIHINSHNPEDKKMPAYARIYGFEETCKKHGIPNKEFFVSLSNNHEDYFKKVSEIYSEAKEICRGKKAGIFCSNDIIAVDFLNAAFLDGRKIPEEFEIIGFDDSPQARQAIIPLTSVRQNTVEIAKSAMELLVKQMDKGKRSKPKSVVTTLEHIVIEPQLAERESTF